MTRIKNYTSNVPVGRTVERIEAALVCGGATGIRKDYDAGLLCAICFTTVHPVSGEDLTVRLSANTKGVYDVLCTSVRKPRKGTLDRLRDQACRTAWKLMQDWVEVQMSLISMHQAEFLQVFMPYMWDGKQTLFDYMKNGGFKLLGKGKRE